MAKRVVKKKAKTLKKKRWIQIQAPALFNKQKIGEAFSFTPEDMVGRSVSVSMSALTGEPQRQSFTARMRITSAEGESLATTFLGFKMLPAAQRKLVRRNREKLADSFVARTKDKKLIRIKPLCVTRGRSTGATLTTMRKLIRAHLAHVVAEMTYEELVSNIVGRRVQQGLQKILRKLHPMGVCEIRELILIPEEKYKFVEHLVIMPAQKAEAAE